MVSRLLLVLLEVILNQLTALRLLRVCGSLLLESRIQAIVVHFVRAIKPHRFVLARGTAGRCLCLASKDVVGPELPLRHRHFVAATVQLEPTFSRKDVFRWWAPWSSRAGPRLSAAQVLRPLICRAWPRPCLIVQGGFLLGVAVSPVLRNFHKAGRLPELLIESRGGQRVLARQQEGTVHLLQLSGLFPVKLDVLAGRQSTCISNQLPPVPIIDHGIDCICLTIKCFGTSVAHPALVLCLKWMINSGLPASLVRLVLHLGLSVLLRPQAVMVRGLDLVLFQINVT